VNEPQAHNAHAGGEDSTADLMEGPEKKLKGGQRPPVNAKKKIEEKPSKTEEKRLQRTENTGVNIVESAQAAAVANAQDDNSPVVAAREEGAQVQAEAAADANTSSNTPTPAEKEKARAMAAEYKSSAAAHATAAAKAAGEARRAALQAQANANKAALTAEEEEKRANEINDKENDDRMSDAEASQQTVADPWDETNSERDNDKESTAEHEGGNATATAANDTLNNGPLHGYITRTHDNITNMPIQLLCWNNEGQKMNVYY